MVERKQIDGSHKRATVFVRVESGTAPRLEIGSRWEVVAPSLDSLWAGAHTVTLRRIYGDKP